MGSFGSRWCHYLGTRSRRAYYKLLQGIKAFIKFFAKWFIKLLIFFSALEDGPYVRLSISKIYMWVSMYAVVYVLHNDISNTAAVLAAGGNQIIATVNYHLRRKLFEKTGKLENVDSDKPNWQEHYGVRNRFPDYSSRMRPGDQPSSGDGV